MKQNVYKIVSVFLILLLPVMLHSEGKDGVGKSLKKPGGTPTRTLFNINNISTWIYNNGDSDLSPTGDSGFEYPKGSNLTAVFETGFVWGGKIDGTAYVGGSTYNQGILPGKVLPDGTPEDPNAPHVRIYRVRSDWQTADLSDDVRKLGLSEEQVRQQYQTDWMEWRAQDGAPFEDVDGNGSYDPAVDIPGVPGSDQTIWYVANDFDPSVTASLYGSDPMKVEVQTTVWGYKSTTALGYTMFRKYMLINKNDKDFEDMYVSLWSDVDLGDAGDDFTGCDVDLSLSYTYNGDAFDSFYGNTPPAIGFDFFQGPVIDGVAGEDVNKNGVDDADDYAIKGGKKIGPGKVNLPMSAHYFFINSDAVYSDPDLRDYNGTLQFFNLFEGKVSTTGTPFVDPTTGQETKFTRAGDPVTGTGWVDGILHSPGDRRQGMVAGPFTMAIGDTQEIVVAQIVAGAFGTVDRLGAIGLLKFYDKEAQATYDNFFQVPKPPAAPVVNYAEFDNEIVLSWGNNNAAVVETETHEDGGFGFQGYVVYQLPSSGASKEDAKIVATFDIVDGVGKIIGENFDTEGGVVIPKVLKFGSDSGIKRSVTISQDLFAGNTKLLNGTPYYFAVTAYAYNPDPEAVPNVLETQMTEIEVVPQSAKPGQRYPVASGDMIASERVTGVSDGVVEFDVVDPSKLTGHEYKVNFKIVDEHVVYNPVSRVNDTLHNVTLWTLTDVTAGTVKLADQVLNNSSSAPMVDGMVIRVSGPAAGFKDGGNAIVEVAYGGTVLTEDQYDAAGAPYLGNKVWHSLNSGQDVRYYVSATGNGDLSRMERWADYLGGRDFELRFTEAGGYAVYAFDNDGICRVPFELWDLGAGTIDDPSDDRRMIPFVLSSDAELSRDDWGWAVGADGYFGYPASDAIYWMDPETVDGYDKFAQVCEQTGVGGTYPYATDGSRDGYFADFYGGFVYPIGRLMVCAYPDASTPVPPAGTTIRLLTNKPITVNDSYKIMVPGVENSTELAKEDVDEINVFPNPYYGVNPNEINKYQRFVTFNHLPEKATIKIVNLAGQMVKVINKEDDSQFAKWDLANERGLPVASGLYLAYVDMPDLGETKVLKVAVILEQQILDRF